MQLTPSYCCNPDLLALLPKQAGSSQHAVLASSQAEELQGRLAGASIPALTAVEARLSAQREHANALAVILDKVCRQGGSGGRGWWLGLENCTTHLRQYIAHLLYGNAVWMICMHAYHTESVLDSGTL